MFRQVALYRSIYYGSTSNFINYPIWCATSCHRRHGAEGLLDSEGSFGLCQLLLYAPWPWSMGWPRELPTRSFSEFRWVKGREARVLASVFYWEKNMSWRTSCPSSALSLLNNIGAEFQNLQWRRQALAHLGYCSRKYSTGSVSIFSDTERTPLIFIYISK